MIAAVLEDVIAHSISRIVVELAPGAVAPQSLSLS
jgi:hypothetical protein